MHVIVTDHYEKTTQIQTANNVMKATFTSITLATISDLTAIMEIEQPGLVKHAMKHVQNASELQEVSVQNETELWLIPLLTPLVTK
jgi:hypothetical protein